VKQALPVAGEGAAAFGYPAVPRRQPTLDIFLGLLEPLPADHDAPTGSFRSAGEPRVTAVAGHKVPGGTMRLTDLNPFVAGWPLPETTVEIKHRGTENGGACWLLLDERHAKVEVGTEAEVGGIFHELFHSVFHHSPLLQGRDEHWGDAWCDGFRYFHDPAFRNRIDRYRRMTCEQARRAGDWNHDRQYAYPCSLIVTRCGTDFGRFRALWLEVCDRRRREGRDILGEVFGYDPRQGVPTPR
jgi:hypothetical protein